MKNNNRYCNLHRVLPRQGRDNFLRLDMNENPEGLPENFVSQVLGTITPSFLAMYPETDTLSCMLADYLKVRQNQVLLTNGSDEAIKLIFEVFGGHGKKFVSVSPSFAMYMVNAKMVGMEHIEIPYQVDFSIHVQSLIDAIDESTAIISLLNPNNPIGNVYSESEILSIIAKAASVNAIVVIDEAYYYFYDHTFLEICKNFDNIILTRTFSKLCSIAGLRIGYAISTPDIIQLLFNAKPSYNINCIGLRFAEELLKRPDLIEDLVRIEREGRDFVIHYLIQKKISYYAENGNYVFIHCGNRAMEIAKQLEEEKVLVKLYPDHPLLGEYIRISTGSKRVMQVFIEKFEKVRRHI